MVNDHWMISSVLSIGLYSVCSFLFINEEIKLVINLTNL